MVELSRLPVVRSLLFLVCLPTLLAAIYYGLVASDIYIAETRFAIRASDQGPTGGLIGAVLGRSGISAGNEDTAIVRDYILSGNMLGALQTALDLESHYTASGVDLLTRLGKEPTREELLEYYHKMIEVVIEPTSDITVLRVRAFTPEAAKATAERILALSEDLVNQLTERITRDTLRFAENELESAETRIRSTSAALTQFRNANRSVDPGEETSALLRIVSELESRLASTRTQLIETRSFMRSSSIQVQRLVARVSALEHQIDRERSRLAGDSGTELTKLISGYQPLLLDHELAEQGYSSALTSLEAARAEAQRKQRYLIPFVAPQLPEEAVEPERGWNILTAFVGSLLLFGIASLIRAAISDHVGF